MIMRIFFILIYFSKPQQSWGTIAQFSIRDSQNIAYTFSNWRQVCLGRTHFCPVSSGLVITSSFAWNQIPLLRPFYKLIIIWEKCPQFKFSSNISPGISFHHALWFILTTYESKFKSKWIQFVAEVNKEDEPGFPTWNFHDNIWRAFCKTS